MVPATQFHRTGRDLWGGTWTGRARSARRWPGRRL